MIRRLNVAKKDETIIGTITYLAHSLNGTRTLMTVATVTGPYTVIAQGTLATNLFAQTHGFKRRIVSCIGAFRAVPGGGPEELHLRSFALAGSHVVVMATRYIVEQHTVIVAALRQHGFYIH